MDSAAFDRVVQIRSLWQIVVMTTRRDFAAALLSVAAAGGMSRMADAREYRQPGSAAFDGYARFLDGVRADARREGVADSVLDEALALQTPNARVLQLDRHQPEFTLTWAQYRDRIISPQREQGAAQAYRGNLRLLTDIWQQYKVDPRVVIGIWGLESNFGTRIGSFNVVDALATLSFDGRRASFFRSELMASLRILGNGDVSPSAMLGSYAGAMGQPQFMPSSYLRYAVDETGDGKRDIWTSRADVFASISNYLARSGWVAGEPWGQPVRLTRSIDGVDYGRQVVRSLDHWNEAGVRRADGGRFSRMEVLGALLLPDGPGGDAFMIYRNFNVIRRYNPSDFYALAVGLIGNAAG